jgi:hypothetical protein
MAIDFDVLQGVLGIDVSKWIKGFTQAQQSVDTFQSATDSATNRVANAVDNVSQHIETMVTKTSAASAQLQGRLFNATDEGFKRLVQNAAEAVGGFDALGKQINESGLSVSKWLDNLEAGAKQVDTSMQEVTASVDTMATSIEQSLDKATAAIDKAVSASANLSTIQESVSNVSSGSSVAGAVKQRAAKPAASAAEKFDVDAFMGGVKPAKAIDNAIDVASIGMDSYSPIMATAGQASGITATLTNMFIVMNDVMLGSATLAEGFAALGAAASVLAGPVLAAGAAIGAIAGSVYVAYENSQSARDMWDSMMGTITTTIDDFTNGVGEAWNAFWEENGQTITDIVSDIGEGLIWLGSEGVKLAAPLVAFFGNEFVEALKEVFKILGIVVNSIKFFVDLVQGDWVNAGRAAIKVYAGLAETLAYLIEVAGRAIKILTLGWTDGGAESAANAIREHAAAHRDVANALTEEEQAANAATEASNQLSRANRTLAAEKAAAAAESAKHAKGGAGGGGHSGSAATGKHDGGKISGPSPQGVLYEDFGTKEAREALASMTKGEGQSMLMNMRKEIEKAMTPNADGVMDGAKANLILSKYKQVLSEIPGFTDHEFEKVADVIKFRIGQAMVNAGTPAIRDLARNAIGDATQGSDVFGIEADKQAERDAKHGSKSTGKASGHASAHSPAAKHTPVARVVEALDAEKVGTVYGDALAKTTRDQAIGQFRELGKDILRELKPDANGIIDPKNAETVLANYRTVLAKMPGFASTEFEKVAAVIRKQIALATQAGGNDLLKEVATNAIDAAVGKEAGGKVFTPQAAADPNAARQRWKEASGNEIQGAMGDFQASSTDDINSLRKQNLAGVKGADGQSLRVEDDMRQLVLFKQQVIAAMAEARKATGEAKEDAVAKVEQLLGKYGETYDKIKSKIDGTYQSAAKAAEDSADKQARAADKVKNANDKVTAPQGVRGGSSSSGSGSGGGSSGSLAANMNSAMGVIANIGQALSGMMNSVGMSVGSGMATEAALDKAITDPIAKIEFAMTKASARIDSLMHNMNAMGGGTMQMALERNNLRDEMQKLSKARGDAIQQREADRVQAAEASARWEREVQAKRAAEAALAAEQMKETQMSIVKAVSNGQQTAITINGVNDPRQVFDVLEREMLRRGLDKSGRRGANLGKK